MARITSFRSSSGRKAYRTEISRVHMILAESFMKHVKKSWHAAIIARKDPVRELQKHLKMVRATPHPTT